MDKKQPKQLLQRKYRRNCVGKTNRNVEKTNRNVEKTNRNVEKGKEILKESFESPRKKISMHHPQKSMPPVVPMSEKIIQKWHLSPRGRHGVKSTVNTANDALALLVRSQGSK